MYTNDFWYILVYSSIFVYLHWCTYLRALQAGVWVYVFNIYLCVCVYTYTHAYEYMYVMYIYIYIHMNIHIHTSIYRISTVSHRRNSCWFLVDIDMKLQYLYTCWYTIYTHIMQYICISICRIPPAHRRSANSQKLFIHFHLHRTDILYSSCESLESSALSRTEARLGFSRMYMSILSLYPP